MASKLTLQDVMKFSMGRNARTWITQRTVERINKIVDVLEAGDEMRPGDRILFKDMKGREHNLLVSKFWDDFIACGAYSVYLNESGYVDWSGGGGFTINTAKVEYVGRQTVETYWTFPEMQCADGAIYVPVNIRVWRYTEPVGYVR